MITAKGESAGGMLVAHCINLRPDLYRAAILKVPFLDVVNTLVDESLPLTVTDYQEFGDIKQKEYFHLISSYSPYENLKPIEYPAILLDVSLDDPRVPSWGSLKYLGKLLVFIIVSIEQKIFIKLSYCEIFKIHCLMMLCIAKIRDVAKSPKRIPDFHGKNIVSTISKDEGHFGSASNNENLTKLIFEYAWLEFMTFEKDTDIV